MTAGADILARMQDHPRLKKHLVLILVQLALAVWVTVDDARYPDVGFELQAEESGLFVGDIHREETPATFPEPGDAVLGIDEQVIDTRTEFWDAMANAEGSVPVTLQRFNVTYQLNLEPDVFESGGLPPGVLANDRPVGMACQSDGAFVELAAVDLEGLKHLVNRRSGDDGLLVYFERPSEEVSAVLEPRPRPLNLPAGAVLLLGAGLMLIVLTQSSRRASTWRNPKEDNRDLYLSVMILLCSLAGVSLCTGPRLASSPVLYTAAVVGLAFFKPVDIEFHLRSRAGWSPIDGFTRLALYIAPAIFAGQVLFYSLGNIRLFWGADIAPGAEVRMDTIWLILAATAAALVVIDAALVLLRHYRRGEDDARASISSRMGLGFSVLFVLAAIYLYVTMGQPRYAGYALSAAFGAQLIGDLVSVVDLPRSYWRADVGQLSESVVVEFLTPIARLFPERDVTIIVARSSFDQQRIGLKLARDEEGQLLARLDREIVPDEWTEFMDILQREELSVPSFGERGEFDPIGEMPARLGILVAWPLPSNVAGTHASFSLFVTRPQAIPAAEPEPLPSPHELPLDQLKELTDEFEEIAPAALVQATDAAPLTLKNADGRLQPPHRVESSRQPAPDKEIEGAVGERSEPSRAASSERDEPVLPSDEAIEVAGEVELLRAQLAAMEAELHRLHPIDHIDPTPSQREAAIEVSEEASPILLLGESGVGKTLVAHLAHNELELGPFIRLVAAELPEAVLEIEIFGDEHGPGRLAAAYGGTLLIEGADRLPDALLQDLLAEVDELDPRDAPRVLLSVDTERDGADPETGEIPPAMERLTARADAEVIIVPPLRDHPEDIPKLAQYFLHRSAMRHDKLITGISEVALEQLKTYDWPGNQRELREVIERAVLVCTSREITERDLSLEFGTHHDGPHSDLDDLTRRAAHAEEEVALLEETEKSLQEELSTLREELAEREQKLAEIAEKTASSADPEELKRLEEHNAELKEKVAALEEESERLVSEQERLKKEREELQEQAETLAKERESLANERDALEQKKEEAETALSKLQERASLTEGDEDVPAIFSLPWEEVEKQLLAYALERAEGNKSQAARDLELKRSTYVNKLKKYGIS